MATFQEALMGKDPQQIQLPRLNPNQLAAQDWQLQTGQQQYQAPQFDFAPIETQTRSNFERKSMPLIAQRWRGLGGSNLGSSGINARFGEAAQDLELGLAAMKAQYGYQQQQQQQQNALQLMQMGMQPTFENVYIPGTGGALGALAGGGGEALGKYGIKAGLGALGYGPWAQAAEDTTKDTGKDIAAGAAAGAAGAGAGQAVKSLTSGTQAGAPQGPVAGAVDQLGAPVAGTAATTAAAKAGLGAKIAGGIGAAAASGLLPASITAGAIITGIVTSINKGKFDTAWESAKQLADAGEGPYPPSKQKTFAKDFKDLQKAYALYGQGRSFEEFLKAGRGEDYRGYLNKLGYR